MKNSFGVQRPGSRNTEEPVAVHLKDREIYRLAFEKKTVDSR